MKNKYAVGVDVGGSHVSSAVIDLERMAVIEESMTVMDVDSAAAASDIVKVWCASVRESIRRAGVPVKEAGFAMPGPFDYVNGISRIEGVGKFGRLFGLDVRQALIHGLSSAGVENIRFINDASAFALGECMGGAARGVDKAMALTLGTGLGSGFISQGRIIESGGSVPANGWVYCLPYGGGIADEAFTTRWFCKRYNELTGHIIDGAKELASRYETDEAARRVFEEYGKALGEFSAPLCKEFGAGAIVLGGNISRSFGLFENEMLSSLREHGCDVPVLASVLHDTAALIGAASIFADNLNNDIMTTLRKTTQHILPVKKEPVPAGAYDIYPTHDLGGGKVGCDYASLARQLSGQRNIVVDGYVGVRFDIFRREMDKALSEAGVEALWWDVSSALKDESEIDKLIEPFLGGDDPIFGYRTSLGLCDLFDKNRLESIKPDPCAPLNIIIGSGAGLAGWDGPLVYLDIPKNEIQFRARAGSITNLGASKPSGDKQMYKRFYFVDWVMLNRHKKEIIDRVDYFVDAQREREITWAKGDDLRQGLRSLSRSAVRVRPWFEPGIWGGSWIKQNIPSLAQDVPNYAWSFELIVPENGIIFESDGAMLEVSFDSVMYVAGKEMVGEECYGAYGDEFPLRMDYLDTFDGGNLSVQCHPQLDYIRKNFGEVLTQEETYYMLDSKKDATVYLGFKEDIVPSEFEKALYESYENCTPLDVDKYVYSLPTEKHALYLIPPGTLHSSGRDNLVLEISTTPYIFTFKMYDWLARDAEGNPRPLNIKRAMENLCFERKGAVVEKEHVSHPSLLKKEDGWQLWHLPTHPKHSYDVHRFVISADAAAREDTNGKCHVINLVEGESLELKTACGMSYTLRYPETMIIPAATGSYTLENTSGKEIMVVKAFMK